MTGSIGKDVLSVVKKRTGKSISERDIRKLAGGVTPASIQNEAELRKLIRRVGAVAGVSVPESLMKEIVSAVKRSGMKPQSMEQMIKKMIK